MPSRTLRIPGASSAHSPRTTVRNVAATASWAGVTRCANISSKCLALWPLYAVNWMMFTACFNSLLAGSCDERIVIKSVTRERSAASSASASLRFLFFGATFANLACCTACATAAMALSSSSARIVAPVAPAVDGLSEALAVMLRAGVPGPTRAARATVAAPPPSPPAAARSCTALEPCARAIVTWARADHTRELTRCAPARAETSNVN